jgi:hypothetical protein
MCEGNVEYLNIIKISSGKKYVLKKLPKLPSSLSYTSLKENESLYGGGTEVHQL